MSAGSLAFDHQLAACLAVAKNPEHSAPLLPDLQPILSSTNACRSAAVYAFNQIIRSPEARKVLVRASDYSPPELVNAFASADLGQAYYSARLLWAGVEEGVITNAQDLFPGLGVARERWAASQPIGARLRAARNTSDGITTMMMEDTLSICLNKTFEVVDPHWLNRHLHILEFGSARERVGAAWALGKARFAPEKAVPLLIENLSSTNRSLVRNSTIALGQYGASANSALPYLSNLLGHSRSRISEAASNSVVQIQVNSP